MRDRSPDGNDGPDMLDWVFWPLERYPLSHDGDHGKLLANKRLCLSSSTFLFVEFLVSRGE